MGKERSGVLGGTVAGRPVKRFVAVNLPQFEEEKGGKEDEVIAKMYQELEEAMGGQEAERVNTWPVVLILATRK